MSLRPAGTYCCRDRLFAAILSELNDVFLAGIKDEYGEIGL